MTAAGSLPRCARLYAGAGAAQQGDGRDRPAEHPQHRGARRGAIPLAHQGVLFLDELPEFFGIM
jgi:hypothetical protein